MMTLDFGYFAPLLVLLASFIFIFIGIKKLGLPGEAWVHVVLSLLLAIMLSSSKEVVLFMFNLMPFIAVLFIVSVLVLIMLVFTGFDFKKPLAIILLVLLGIIALMLAFYHFNGLNAMLPNSSSAGLNSNAIEFKQWIYSTNVKDSIILIISVLIVAFFLVKK